MEKNPKTEIHDLSVDIARYYGFTSLSEVIENTLSRGKYKKINPPSHKDGLPGEISRANLMKMCLDYDFLSINNPLMIYHTETLRKEMSRENFGGKDGVLFGLEIIGVQRSIAEAMLFKTAFTILAEAGFTDLSVEINSLGDRESISRFSREFNNYFKKHEEEIPSHCRSNVKKDIFKVLECAQDKCMLFKEHAPKPIGSLTENSRNHFAEVLEYLESMDVPYRINNCLVGGRDYYTRTIFEIRTENANNRYYPKKSFEVTLARGGRYDDLAKTLGAKKEIPSVGITISMGGLGIIEPKKSEQKKTRKPKVFLLHLGFEAKIKSLHAIEVLRRGRIPIYQSLSKDRLSAQISTAESMDIPFMIIIGHKEALDGTAIIRNMRNRSQETVSILELPQYVKIFEKDL